jgi:SAM-dependent methyltransferase
LAAYPVLRKFGKPVGYQYILELPKDLEPGRHRLQFYALSASGRRELGSVLHFEAVDRSTKMSFSQRFASIPVHLVGKVNGSLLESDFVNIGNVISDVIETSVSDLYRVKKSLDFGCGLGRILSSMLRKAPQAEFTGFDVDPLMLSWCSYLLQDANCRFVYTTLELPDSAYDFIYAVSVFTHLDASTDYWLAEIHRLLAPGGRAFITYHDETLFEEIAGGPSLPSIPKGAKLNARYVTGNETPEGGAAMGTFYTTEFWNGTLERYFAVDRSVPRGLFGHQSFSLIAKKEARVDRIVSDRQYICQLEQQLFKLRNSCKVMY